MIMMMMMITARDDVDKLSKAIYSPLINMKPWFIQCPLKPGYIEFGVVWIIHTTPNSI